MENVCRTCLRSQDNLLPLFVNKELLYKIRIISAVELCEDSNLPSEICEECVSNVNKFFNFRKVLINSNIELDERLVCLKRVEVTCTNTSSEFIQDDNLVTHPDLPQETCTENETASISSTTKAVLTTAIKLQRKRRLFKCSKCTFSTQDLSTWKNHKRTLHYPVGICNICGKTLRQDNLSKHVRNHSSPPVRCNICSKLLKNPESLRSHVLIHRSKDFPCPHCDKVYTCKGARTQHIKRYHDVVPPEKCPKCPLCEKTFTLSKGLKRHMQSHTGERPYVCEYCKRGFSSPFALKTHIRQHTNETPFMCERCPAAFRQKVSLVTHVRSKHKEDCE